jgi:uncharacterized protein (UPF0261 family)
MYARPGGPLHDERGDRAFAASLRRHVVSRVRVLEEDAWINDPSFADRAANLLLEMLDARDPQVRAAAN